MSTIDDERILCLCHCVSYGDIRRAIEGGAKTFEEVQRKTHLGMSCGGCLMVIRDIVNRLITEREQ